MKSNKLERLSDEQLRTNTRRTTLEIPEGAKQILIDSNGCVHTELETFQDAEKGYMKGYNPFH